MADESQTTEASNEGADEPKGSLLMRARRWAFGSRLRQILVGGGLLGLMGVTVAVWLVLASMAAQPSKMTIGKVLEKLDEGDLEIAEEFVKLLQENSDLKTEDYGGPLFVLGAIRAKEADSQWAPERRRRDYLVAAKYLEEALSLGVPDGREYEAKYLLGKALIGSDQLEKGAEVLEGSLEADPAHSTATHLLLAEANYFAGHPEAGNNYEKALRHIEVVVTDPELPAETRGKAMLRQAHTLSRLGRHEEAIDLLGALPPEAHPAKASMVRGQVLLAAANASQPPRRGELLVAAEQSLAKAEQLDKLSIDTSAAAQYFRGRISELRGQYAQAVEQYTEVRRRFGMSVAGVAASVAEGDLMRERRRAEEALTAYRRSLDAVRELSAYKSELLPTSDLRTTVLTAHSAFIGQGEYEVALALVGRADHLLGEALHLELQAETQQRWGEALLGQSQQMPELASEGRKRLREAGVTYESLADQRFATTKYPDDLWRAAEAYYHGQSYTSTARVLRDYIRNEPLSRNAQALLRLGQALLALRDPVAAIEAFEECIESHPDDAAVFGARLSAARAYRDRGSYQRAEQLLRDNLLGGTLTPRSPEWRDSKFELGSLLHDMGRHVEAIDELEEAILRYGDLPGVAGKIREARYLAAESYRSAAQEPIRIAEEAKSVSEREKNEQLYRALLTKAAKHYDDVQREISGKRVMTSTDRKMLRNCYMLKGSVYFDLQRFREAADEYSNVSALYQNEPFVLETLLQISYCWRQMGDPEKARGNVDQALLALRRLPEDVDLTVTTTRSRAEWKALLTELRNW